ncbi:hypothetical protein CEE37_10900 [candidate division LCP-89 bacterium B3_LCP]|uniref:Uncharacterized protein n=1 Tax=candidate division LCP-89 bacterium B3_LCP TaxID=2012998 RepID=A0A532UYF9_UNCL8|nr:MAG: hypothetical protein CEE37_10900 [candidate division LCP-89 bacterium B3_LCP]
MDLGTQLLQTKRFSEAQRTLYQALEREPQNVGVAYMLSLALYFNGSFPEAFTLFNQLLQNESLKSNKQADNIRELSVYAYFECLRMDYWQQFELQSSEVIETAIKERGWDPSSLQAFHLYFHNGKASDWIDRHSRGKGRVTAEITTRNGDVKILKDCVDSDMSIGAHLEGVQDSQYSLIPFAQIKSIVFGKLGRWIGAEVVYQDDTVTKIFVPLLYRESALNSDAGVREGVDTVLRPLAEDENCTRAFGQKQFRADIDVIGISEIESMQIFP